MQSTLRNGGPRAKLGPPRNRISHLFDEVDASIASLERGGGESNRKRAETPRPRVVKPPKQRTRPAYVPRREALD